MRRLPAFVDLFAPNRDHDGGSDKRSRWDVYEWIKGVMPNSREEVQHDKPPASASPMMPPMQFSTSLCGRTTI
ncbi:MAG TPA: hypothetical protein VE621_24420 [Bryobacteraceae bacterium]|nr:hypothetical protein [Bryobacteraceae bacterium]